MKLCLHKMEADSAKKCLCVIIPVIKYFWLNRSGEVRQGFTIHEKQITALCISTDFPSRRLSVGLILDPASIFFRDREGANPLSSGCVSVRAAIFI